MRAVKREWHRWSWSIVIGTMALVLNFVVYFVLPRDIITAIGAFGYAGAFAVAAIANASIILPIPYYPVIARLAQVLDVWGVIIAAAAGSTIGESVAFFVGRAGSGPIQQTRISKFIERQLRHPWRSAIVLFAFAAPPNPAFDIAGLIAGALDLPLWLFITSVFLGRIVRMSLVAFIGLTMD
jgi:membrane protein YqaA with SNARE-associated domain